MGDWRSGAPKFTVAIYIGLSLQTDVTTFERLCSRAFAMRAIMLESIRHAPVSRLAPAAPANAELV